jgi:hypothetical protein
MFMRRLSRQARRLHRRAQAPALGDVSTRRDRMRKQPEVIMNAQGQRGRVPDGEHVL